MQSFKTLLVAVTVIGSSAAFAADATQPSTPELRALHTSNYGQSQPAQNELKPAWPQWMYNLSGTVLVLHEVCSPQASCSDLQSYRLPAVMRVKFIGAEQHQLAELNAHVPTPLNSDSVQWNTHSAPRLPQRWSF